MGRVECNVDEFNYEHVTGTAKISLVAPEMIQGRVSVPGVSGHIRYLFQVDVLIDDRLVPLWVKALAGVFGPPLVFSTGGTHYKHIHGGHSRDTKSLLYGGPPQCGEKTTGRGHDVTV